MKIFIDTAILKEIEWAEERGLIDGVTTNPSLLTKADRKLGEVVRDILGIVRDRPVSIEAVSKNADDIIEEGREISKLAKNVVVKIPMTDEGMMAVRALSAKGIKTDVTLVFRTSQALLAARAGATYVSVFDGRLDNIGDEAMDVIRETAQVFKNYEFATELLVASIRDVKQVEASAAAGVDVVTVPFKVLVQMYRHVLTDKGLNKFLEDWEKIPK